MRFCSHAFLMGILVLATIGLKAQTVEHSADSDLLGRFSYNNSPSILMTNGVRNLCLTVSDDGEYRIMRSVNSDSGPQMVRLHGNMPKEALEQLKALLAASDFLSLPRMHGGLIRGGSERFEAELPRSANGSLRVQWLNADGESPFPPAAAKVVDWLKHFEPKDGKRFVYADYPDVCPSGGLRLVQPTVAENTQP
jgi:hypothetical protein